MKIAAGNETYVRESLPEAAEKPVGRLVVLLGIALVIITLGVYWQVADHQFLSYDDDVYITNNPHVANGMTTSAIAWAFTAVDAANWHPLTWLSHLADVELYGMEPRGHHLTNVALHAVSALFVLLLFVRMTGAVWRSFFVAALFALHPLHVESVAWAAERKDVLSGLFWFLTLFLYAGYVAQRKPVRYVATLCCFVLGLMAKPMLVTLPVIMLLLDVWPLRRYREETVALRQLAALMKEKIPFFVCSLLSCLVTIYAQGKGEAINNPGVVPLQLRCLNALIAYTSYIGKTLWPADLAVLYPFQLLIPVRQAIGPLIILALLTVVAVRIKKRYPYVMVGWLWFLITLVPVIGIIQVGAQAMADRYAYLPSIGLFVLLGWGGTDLTSGWRYQRSVLSLLSAAIIVVSAALTWQQLGYWRDNSALYRHTLQVTTGNYIIHNNLGQTLQAKGDLDGAIEQYQQSLRIKFSHAGAHNNLGTAFQGKELLDAAIQEYRLALQINPANPEAHSNLGAAFTGKGYLNAAIEEYQRALLIDPGNINAHNNLGVVFVRRGDLAAAIREYQEALRIRPGSSDARNNLEQAVVLQRLQGGAGK